MWLFYCFNFERNYDVLKSKSPCILLNKNINFNKNDMELKLENPTHSFRENDLVLQLIQESQIKSKTVIKWSLQKNKDDIFVQLILSKDFFFFFLCFISMYIVFNTLKIYILLYIKKHYLAHFFTCL